MGITHVIRGDDHISNTPKHILLWQALGRTPPEFAHVPLILGTDKKKLSKRHGITSVTEYERLGYLSGAMVNFLALLGWSPGGDREVMSRDELIGAFSLEGISGGAAVFDPEKLDWYNAQYLAQLKPEDLTRYVKPLLQAAGLWRGEFDDTGPSTSLVAGRREWLQRVLRLVLPRVRRLPDFVEQAGPFLTATVDYDPDAVRKHLTTADLDQHVDALIAALEADAEPFEEAVIERVLRRVADARGIKAAALIHAARIAATGKGVSPGIFEVLALLGKPLALSRLRDLARYLRASAS
jgi:glutamyl-tRNA synthetase